MMGQLVQALLAAQKRRAAALSAAAKGAALLQQGMSELLTTMSAPRKIQRDPESNLITGYTIGGD
jgi:hypothetical protein